MFNNAIFGLERDVINERDLYYASSLLWQRSSRHGKEGLQDGRPSFSSSEFFSFVIGSSSIRDCRIIEMTVRDLWR